MGRADLGFHTDRGAVVLDDGNCRRVYLEILKLEERRRDFAGKIKRENLRRPALQEEFAKVKPGWRELP